MKKTLLFLFLFYFAFATAQQSEKVTINWKSNSDYNIGETTIKVPQFDLEFYNLDIPLKKIQFRKIVSVSSKIITVMRKLYKGKTVKYSSLFEAAEGRSDLVATFLAVLELVKGKRVRVEGDGDNAEVKMI